MIIQADFCQEVKGLLALYENQKGNSSKKLIESFNSSQINQDYPLIFGPNSETEKYVTVQF